MSPLEALEVFPKPSLLQAEGSPRQKGLDCSSVLQVSRRSPQPPPSSPTAQPKISFWRSCRATTPSYIPAQDKDHQVHPLIPAAGTQLEAPWECLVSLVTQTQPPQEQAVSLPVRTVQLQCLSGRNNSIPSWPPRWKRQQRVFL